MRKSNPFRRISNKNVQELMVISPSSATRILNQVRALFEKPKGAPVYLAEFCEYNKFDIDQVREFFNWD
jgi:hypothetical protein